MAEIKDFSNSYSLLKRIDKKTNKGNRQNEPSADSKLARYRQVKLYTVLIIIVLVAIAIACAYYNWKNMLYTSYEIIQQNQWQHSKDSTCISLENMLFCYSNDGMSCTDTKGYVVWNQTYEMQNPIVRTCGRTVAVGDYNGRSIYVADTQGNVGTINTTMPIRDFCVSENGIVAAVLDDSTVTAIYLYSKDDKLNKNGKEELVYFKTTMSKSGYPLGIDISADGTMLAISYIKAENGKVSSNIGFYNFSSVGQNYTDNLVGGYKYHEAVVPMVKFMGNNTIFAVSDNRLMFFRGKQKPESLSEIMIYEQIQGVYHDRNHVGLVFYNPTGETKYTLQVYDTNAKKTSELNFDMEFTDIIFDAAAIIVRNDEECMIYDWNNQLKYQGLFTEKISYMLSTGNISKYTLVTDTSIQHIELR